MADEKSLAVSEITVPNFEVREKQLGILVTNAREIRDALKAKMQEFSLDVYTGDAKQAAEDKAKLNNIKKQLNGERITLERDFMKPFGEFKDVVSEAIGYIDVGIGKLETIVKENDRLEKEAKKADIQKIWDSQNFSLVPLEKVFNSKWLNKGTKLSAIEKEIPEIIDRIKKDIAALDSFGEDAENLKGFYLSTLNLQAALSRGAELKANRGRIAAQKAEEERRRAEEEARLAQEKAEREQAQEIPETEETHEDEEEEPSEISANNAEEQKVEQPEAQAPRSVFNFIGNGATLVQLSALARKCGLEIIDCLALKGGTAEMTALKKAMEENGIVYDKKHFLTLEVN